MSLQPGKAGSARLWSQHPSPYSLFLLLLDLDAEAKHRDRPPDPGPPGSTLVDCDLDRVALIDWDPQGCLTGWHNRRLGRRGPTLIQTTVTDLASTLRELRDRGVQQVFIDTPPGHGDITERAMASADGVITPVKPGESDIKAALATVAMAEALRVNHVLMINDGNFRGVATGAAVQELRNLGVLMIPPLHHRVDFMLAGGLTVTERSPKSAAARELRRAFNALRAVLP